MLSLINDILDFSKVEAGKLELESINFDVRLLFEDFALAVSQGAQDKGHEIVLDTNDLVHAHVNGDPHRIRQILTNLVDNAVKFTSAGEVVIRAASRALDD